MKYRLAWLILILTGLVWVAGCSDTPESVQTVEVATTISSGVNTRVISVSSTIHYVEDKEKEVRPKFEGIINGGQYNITSVRTSYILGRLVAGEVVYDSVARGDGNKIRVLFISSSSYYYNDRDKEVRSKLDEMVNSGKYDVVKIQTIYASGYLLAAEVYYREMK